MNNNINSFDNLESSIRKSSVIQERINLVSSHMYKQFLEYQHSTINTSETFLKMVENMESTVEFLKQSFAARGVATQNIYHEVDMSKTVAMLNILWHAMSFTTRCNNKPQALYREEETPIITGRIMALNGIYSEIVKKNPENEMQALLDAEIASLFIPADKSQNAIIKIKHLGNREFYINQMDAPREFLLKVVETVCGGGICHEEYTRKLI